MPRTFTEPTLGTRTRIMARRDLLHPPWAEELSAFMASVGNMKADGTRVLVPVPLDPQRALQQLLRACGSPEVPSQLLQRH